MDDYFAYILDRLQFILPLAPGLLFSLTIHEFAHARVALAFGDHTAYYLGRVTLNPAKHLDPAGTLMILFGPFGWGKPVPVNPNNLHPRRWGDIAVSLAGPASNLLFAVALAIVFRIAFVAGWLEGSTGHTIHNLLGYTLAVNLMLFMFNLVPLYPLDGHHILREILPPHLQSPFMAFQRTYGTMLLLAVLVIPWALPEVPDLIGIVFEAATEPIFDWLTSSVG